MTTMIGETLIKKTRPDDTGTRRHISEMTTQVLKYLDIGIQIKYCASAYSNVTYSVVTDRYILFLL
jgi:hypothetical protein